MMKRSAFKRKAPKKRAGHDKEMLSACRGEGCYLRIPGVCIGGTDTVVPCHANWPEYGKGMGIKARDEYTVPGCRACHYWLDFRAGTKDEKKSSWVSAYNEWKPSREAKLAQK